MLKVNHIIFTIVYIVYLKKRKKKIYEKEAIKAENGKKYTKI